MGADSAALAGSAWQILDDDAGSPGAPDASVTVSAVAGQDGVFEVSGLTAGWWWLTETKAPAGYNLLAEPVRFRVDSAGAVTLGAGASGNVTAAAAPGGGPLAPWWVITVKDVRLPGLPYAGGDGAGRVRLTGGALLLLSLLAGAVIATRDRRRYARAG
ncbi:MAG: prealbumin-like fold domain-containing protein [Actinomycetia bacterium]|nr:prealbumin-like fold domain-containing protein [Actinomycetes bacterium]